MSKKKIDPKVQEAMKKEGFLGKQTRGVIQKYVQRYWMITDNGMTLDYANTKQDVLDGKLKGKLALKDVLDIHDEKKPKKFHLILEGRVYKVEAQNVADKASWMEALRICIKYAQECEDKEQKDLKAIDDDIIFEQEHDKPEENKTHKALQPFSFLANTAKSVAVDTVLNTGVKIFKTGVNTVGNVILGEKLASDRDFLKAKGLLEKIDEIDPKLLKSRLLMGYLFKESKEATGFGLVDDLVNDVGIRETIQKQWFLLISSKPILLEEIDEDDDKILDAGQIPVEIDLETLYIYDKSCDDSQPMEIIPMNDVTDITIKKKGTEDLSYRFVLNLGEKKIQLITETMAETTKWVKAIQASRATVKEQTKSKLGVVKNIYWYRKIFDEKGEDQLFDKLEREFEVLVANNEAPHLDGVFNLLHMQKVEGEEMLAIINSCLVHKDRRIDIIKVAVGIYHENIITSLRNYFKRNMTDFPSSDCFEIIKFLIWYRDMLQMFGPAFLDKRIVDGITTLCQIVVTRILRANVDSVQNIVKEELESEPTLDGKNRLRTNGPQDIFRILHESFKILSMCNTKELAIALLGVVKSTLLNFQGGLNHIIEECAISFNHLGAFCNNTMTYMSQLKEFIEEVHVQSSLPHDVISENLKEEQLNKGFVDVSKKAYEALSEEQFSYLKDDWRSKPYLTIDLRAAIEEKLQEVIVNCDKIHSNYVSKIELGCLEKIAATYVQNFLKSAERKLFRKEDCPKISEKLDEDFNYLRDTFLRSLKANTIESVIQPLKHFHDFLNTNYAFLGGSVKTMKETYGKAIKWQTIDLLIRIRNDELDENERKEIFKQCEEVYKGTQARERSMTYNLFKHVNQDANEEEVEDDQDSFTSDDESQSTEPQSPTLRSSMSMKVMEGYLEAEKDEFVSIGMLGDAMGAMGGFMADLKFERLWFTIRKGVLYSYKSKNAETAHNSYKLKDVVECAPLESDMVTFFLKIRSKIGEGEIRRMIFKAENVEKRGQWVSAINEAIVLEESLNTMTEVSSKEVQLFKDTKPLFTNSEEPVDLKFEFKFKLVEDELPVDAPRRSTIIFKKNIKKNLNPNRGIGCFARFCLIFGIGKKASPADDDDYVSLNEDVL